MEGCLDAPLVKTLDTGPILHVVVVGFHHKKGCQVEYAYPPFQDGESVENSECPEEWKHLPSLALPDGSHNFEKDTIYFHMPSRRDPAKTVFGISCYRQINAESLINRSADITRGTVQKSVCILSTLPLYGLINAKLELITHAYFDERDFSKVSLLEETFKNLNSSLKEDLTQGQHVFLGLSAKDLVLQFKHKIVLLVKLILLERKILFLKSPVKNLCVSVLSLLSLFPGMIENGLENSMKLAEIKDSCANFEIIPDDILEINDEDMENHCEIKNALDASIPENRMKEHTTEDKSRKLINELKTLNRANHPGIEATIISSSKSDCTDSQTLIESIEDAKEIDEDTLLADLLDCEAKEKVDLTKSKLEFQDRYADVLERNEMDEGPSDNFRDSNSSLSSKESVGSLDGIPGTATLKGKVIEALSFWASGDKPKNDDAEQIEMTVAGNGSDSGSLMNEVTSNFSDFEQRFPPLAVINLDINKCGLPLNIFNEGMLCHPYLSLPFLDLLKDPSVRGFLAGATNVLFKQKRNLVDVIVEIDDGKVEILDNDLRKLLHLTTEDLRFADYLVKNVSEEQQDVFLDGIGWEGGDEWLRAQFKLYILCLLRTSMLQEGSREIDSFNASFISAWKQTRSYSVWKDADHWSVLEINPGHPFQGQLSMSDMRLRISHTMQNSERGRKINQAVMNTGKAVAQTSRALGGAISHAKSAVSSWLQMFGNSSLPPQQPE